MDRWRGRVAVVTGASSGIGAAIAYQLQDAGVNVVAVALCAEDIQDGIHTARDAAQARGRKQIGKAAAPGALHPLKCDVTKEEEIVATFKWVKDNLGGVDILVNNAGRGGNTKISEAKAEEWKNIIDINVMGVSICTREALQQMKDRNVDDGHIVNMGSTVGHAQPITSQWSMYNASKHAIRVLSEGLRKELVAAKSNIKVTEMCPGLVRTRLFEPLRADHEKVWESPHIFPEDIADAVLYSLATPSHMQIQCMIVKPTGEVQ